MRHIYEVSCPSGTTQILSALEDICEKRELTPTDTENVFHIHLSASEFKQLRAKGCTIKRLRQKKVQGIPIQSPYGSSPSRNKSFLR